MTLRSAPIVMTLTLVLAACGKDNNDNNKNNVILNNVNNQNNNNDMGLNNGDMPGGGCENAESLMIGSPIQPEFVMRGNTPTVSCFDDIDVKSDSGTWALTFSLDTLSQVDFTVLTEAVNVDQPPATVWELHSGCDTSEDPLVCGTTDLRQVLGPGDYILTGTGDLERALDTVTVTINEIECVGDPDICTDGVLTRCTVEGKLEDFTCPAECLSADGCAGDLCTEISQVQLVANTPQTFVVDRSLLSHTWNADGLDGCSLTPNEPAGPSLGVDFFIEFTGLVAGWTLELDAEASDGNVGFYISDECNPATCETAFAFDANSDNKGDFVVPSDGSWIVAFESLGTDEGEISITANLAP